MQYLARLCVCVLTVVVVFAGLSRVVGAWFGQEVSVLQVSRLWIVESRRTEALRQRSEEVARALAIKQEIVEEILAGRLSLRESATEFQEANELIDKDDLDLLPDYYVPETEEAVCEQVLTWVRSEARQQSSTLAKGIVKGLEKEFEVKFGRPCPDATTPEGCIRDETDASEGEASAPCVAG
jgi:hypothetical protein